jgi:hypothetical protein
MCAKESVTQPLARSSDSPQLTFTTIAQHKIAFASRIAATAEAALFQSVNAAAIKKRGNLQ